MDVLINGEVYLKKAPDYDTIINSLKKLMAKDKVETEETEEFEENFEEEHDEEYYDRLMQLYKDFNTPLPIWDGCNNFWTSLIHEQGLIMVQHNYLQAKPKKIFCNKEKFDKKFISLRDFFNEAEYVGRYFRRTKPISTGTLFDTSYMSRDNDIFVLFKNEDLMIVLKQFAGEMQYSIISKQYLKDGNYEFFGEYNEEYNDKLEVYQAILKQLCKNKKNSL